MLEMGTKAPSFCLPNEIGEMVALDDFKGKKVVLYFYPKDNTPGCTTQALEFAKLYEQISQYATVIGISKDSMKKHANFKEKNHLPFILLADEKLEAIQAYDVWQEKKLYGKVNMGVVRTTYIIDEAGMIEKVMPKVKAATNPQEVLDYLRS